MKYRINLMLAFILGGYAILELGSGVYILAKAQLAQVLVGSAWQQTLIEKSSVKPWPWADTWPVARLRVPAQNIDLIVLSGSSGHTMAFGPGHQSSSVNPGDVGVSIIGGHRDTHFRFLQDLKMNDKIIVQTMDRQEHVFRVVNHEIANSRKSGLSLQAEEPLMALVTCYPFDALRPGGPLRYVVVAAADFSRLNYSRKEADLL